MPTSSVAVCSLTIAILGFGAVQAFAQGANVTAFNPYSGIGLPGGPVPQYGPQAAYPIVDTVGPGGGPAFNPWQGGKAVAAYPLAAVSVPVSAGVPASVYSYNPGAYLPAPPPGPIESRIVAIPELGNAPPSRRSYAPPPAATPPAPTQMTVTIPPPPPVITRAEFAARSPSAATPTPLAAATPIPPTVTRTPPAAAPAATAPQSSAAPAPAAAAAPALPATLPAPPATTRPPPAVTPPSSATPGQMAAVTPAPPAAAPTPPATPSPSPSPAAAAAIAATTRSTSPPAPSPPETAQTPPVRSAAVAPTRPMEPSTPPILPNSSVAATIAFTSQSAVLSNDAKVDLDRLAKNLGDRRPRLIEIRAYAGSGDPDSRKVSLARALVVRSYLIDKGIKTRIEVGAFGGDSRGGGSERVDILVPNS